MEKLLLSLCPSPLYIVIEEGWLPWPLLQVGGQPREEKGKFASPSINGGGPHHYLGKKYSSFAPTPSKKRRSLLPPLINEDPSRTL